MKPLILLYSLFSLFFFLHPSFAQNEPASTAPTSAPGAAPAPPEKPSSTCPTPPCRKNFHQPSFRVVFHNLSGQTHLLIPPKTPLHQIENLIYYLSEGLKNNEFEKIGIPPNGSGDYTRGSILVFKELKWAKGERLTNPRIKEKTYSRYVLAEYIWNSHSETAYIGQKNLFSRSLPSPK
ncbi:MAG: hypothetical protein HYR79_04195 [Nitrospirae bacterium]|nr:hypothetical protein [Nitrospirota bacterium]